MKFSRLFQEGQTGMGIHHILDEPDKIFGHQIGATPTGSIHSVGRVVDPVAGRVGPAQRVQ